MRDARTVEYSLGGLNRRLFTRLLIVALMMFGFGYALVPLYRKICEVTGINVVTSKFNYGGTLTNTQVDTARLVTVEFDANTQGSLHFRPVLSSLQIHPGEIGQVVYEVVNTQSQAISAQAIPSYAPKQATRYFKKLECFCFKQQALNAHENRRMPVVFMIDPALPKDIRTITLSYTFFEIVQPMQQREPKS